MINSINISAKSDLIGMMASGLCFLHCVATPFIFVAHASSVILKESHPWWWGTLDIVFLVISFFAIYWSTRTTSGKWIKYIFWLSWIFLCLLILNEKLELWHISEEVVYMPAITLIFLHFYNHRYCRSDRDNCGVG